MGFSIFFQRAWSLTGSFLSALKRRGFTAFFLAGAAFPAEAVSIQFPDEELASESVLPLIQPARMVLNRNIPLTFRAEAGIGVGFGLTEPFYYPFHPSVILAFHFAEAHAVSAVGAYFFPWRSKDGVELSKGVQIEDEKFFFDPLKIPYPQYSGFLNYQYTPYYGKISLTKSGVMNLSIYGFAGLGLVVSNQNDQWPAGNFGIGQKLYFNKWLGIRGDLGFYGYYGPAPARLKLGQDVTKLTYSQLKPEDKRLMLHVVANLGVIILI